MKPILEGYIGVDFEINDKVSIKLNGMMGEVKEIWIDRDRIQYNVEWTGADDNIHDRWFLANELREIPESSNYRDG